MLSSIKKFGVAVIPALVLSPMIAFAELDDVTTLISTVAGIIKALIPIFIAIAFLTFIYGLIKYMVVTDDDKKKEAKSVMIYGVIGLFVIVSVWGLVEFLQTNLGISGEAELSVPVVPGLDDAASGI